MRRSLFIISSKSEMGNVMIKKIIRYGLSIIGFVSLFGLLQRLVEPKYTEDIPEGNFTSEYYEETIEHDVIMIGDCEVYENFDPIYMWQNYGITAYIRGNAGQLTWQSYYMLLDTLKYETPKVVVYNVQALTHDCPQREEYNRMTLDGMRWSKIKCQAVQASMCKGENFIDYVFPLFRYHSRITELTKGDIEYYFKRKKVTHNGYYMRIDTLPLSQSKVVDGSWLLDDLKGDGETQNEGAQGQPIIDPWASVEAVEEEEAESGKPDLAKKDTKGETFGEYPMGYLDKMRRQCEEKGITFLLVKAPSVAPQWYDGNEAQVQEYARKNHIPYINFYDLIQETGLDYETDTYDGGFHLNRNGADKISGYLGKELMERYGIPDRRQDEKYKSVYGKKEGFYDGMIRAQQQELEMYGEIRNY